MLSTTEEQDASVAKEIKQNDQIIKNLNGKILSIKNKERKEKLLTEKISKFITDESVPISEVCA